MDLTIFNVRIWINSEKNDIKGKGTFKWKTANFA